MPKSELRIHRMIMWAPMDADALRALNLWTLKQANSLDDINIINFKSEIKGINSHRHMSTSYHTSNFEFDTKNVATAFIN